jgi:GH18 family chitinase
MITKAGVPGEKVIVGVTSYGRSFKMVDANCWGPDCLYTSDRLGSNVKKGKCTGIAGYLADAKIAEIMKDSSRVVRAMLTPLATAMSLFMIMMSGSAI